MALVKVTLKVDDKDDYDGLFDKLMRLGAEDIEIEEIEATEPVHKVERKPKKKTIDHYRDGMNKEV